MEQDLNGLEPELVAQWLESSGNFKVLRRIQTRASFGAKVEHPVKVLVVDTETTGLELSHAELIEVGALLVEVDGETGQIGRVLGQYGGLEAPRSPIPAESTAIHGITNEMVEGQTFNDDELLALLDVAQVVVAHNAAFDKPFLVRRFPRFAEVPWACSFQEVPWNQEGYQARRLDALLSECGFYHGAHRAVEDCNALVHVLARPLKESQRMPFQVIFEGMHESIYEIAALKAPFEKKEAMKLRGFRWNGEERVWEYRAVGFAQGKEVIEWLRTEVYETNQKIMLGFRTRGGLDRYSADPVKQQFKEV